MELEIGQILKMVEKSIREVASVEGEITRVINIGNRIAVRFKSGNNYDLGLLSKNANQAVLDGQHVKITVEPATDGLRT